MARTVMTRSLLRFDERIICTSSMHNLSTISSSTLKLHPYDCCPPRERGDCPRRPGTRAAMSLPTGTCYRRLGRTNAIERSPLLLQRPVVRCNKRPDVIGQIQKLEPLLLI